MNVNVGLDFLINIWIIYKRHRLGPMSVDHKYSLIIAYIKTLTPILIFENMNTANVKRKFKLAFD